MRVHPEDLRTIWNRRWRLEHLYKIRREDRTLGPLKFNRTQERLWKKAEAKNFRGMRIKALKDRKMGVTTFWAIFYLDDSLFTPNTTSCIQAHKQKDLEKIFEIVKLAYHTCPDSIQLADCRVWNKPKANYDNKNELKFDEKEINSTIYVTLESRGNTNNNLHISEAAFILNEDRIRATLGSVPNIEKGSNITVESTANGVGGWFQESWSEDVDGNGVYDPCFFAWYEDSKYEITPPDDWEPGKAEQELAERVKTRTGIVLSRRKLYWWHRTKKEQKGLMDQEFPTFPEDAFLITGNAVFDPEFMAAYVVKPPIRAIHTRWGPIKIYAEPKPGRRYVLGGDPAEGVGGDRSSAEVVDALTLEQVAEFVSDQIKPAEFATVVDRLGRMYNNAIAAIERNNHGHTTLDRLKDTYGNIYMQQIFDEKTKKKTKKMGWLTDTHTRDLMLDELEELVGDMTVKLHSDILRSEMLTFITNEDGKREAKAGQHDDTVMALAIAIKVARLPRNSFSVYALTT